MEDFSVWKEATFLTLPLGCSWGLSCHFRWLCQRASVGPSQVIGQVGGSMGIRKLRFWAWMHMVGTKMDWGYLEGGL